MIQIATTLFLLLSMVAVVRALSIMRLGNALQSGALIFKIILNFSGAALIIVTGAELPTAYKAVALFMVFLQFLNPVALTIYFTPPQAGTGLRTISVGFAVVMMPLLLWYLAMDAQWTVSHPLPVWLFEFSLDHPGDFGAWSILYKIITPTVLAVLIYQQISHYWSRSQGFVKHKLWEIFYLTNGLVRALILVAVLEIASTSITSIFTVLSAIMGLSLLVDTGIILIFATNRAVQFHRDYGLSLRGSWSAQLEQIVYTAAKPEHYLKPKFTLADLSEAAGIPSYLVTRIVNKGTGLQVKELMNHFRVRHYETLVRNHPNERKKVLLAQSGFNSYASYYAARK